MGDVNDRANSFLQTIQTQAVLVRRAFIDSEGREGEVHGSGVIIGHGRGPNNTLIKIATAGHVLDRNADEVASTWQVTRMEKLEDGTIEERSQQFTPIDGAPPHIVCCDYLRNVDIGVIAIENRADGETPRRFIDTENHAPLKLAPRIGGPTAGVRVAWAGFPGFVKQMTDRFNICYFEGVVSAVSDDPPVILVDGHTAPGVSGGPMWMCDKEGNPIVIGVCINYSGPGDLFPGLAGFCPINLLVNHLEEVAAQHAQLEKNGS